MVAATRANRDLAPKYVRHCVDGDEGLAPYQLVTWERGKPERATAQPAKCGSWRCPSCRRYRASVDFARMLEALGPHGDDELTFMVLTLDRDGRYSGEAWADSDTAYKALSRMQRALMKRLNRMLEDMGGDRVGSRWVAVVEAHRSGWPHINLVMVSKTLHRMVKTGMLERLEAGLTDRESTLVQGGVLGHVIGSGFGVQTTAEPIRDRGAVAGYLVKLAGELDEDGTAESRGRLGAEVVKVSQVPMNAPKNFRRLRSGRGFLPPRRKGEKTGVMLDHRGRAMGMGLPDAGDPQFKAKKARRVEVTEALEVIQVPEVVEAEAAWERLWSEAEGGGGVSVARGDRSAALQGARASVSGWPRACAKGTAADMGGRRCEPEGGSFAGHCPGLRTLACCRPAVQNLSR